MKFISRNKKGYDLNVTPPPSGVSDARNRTGPNGSDAPRTSRSTEATSDEIHISQRNQRVPTALQLQQQSSLLRKSALREYIEQIADSTSPPSTVDARGNLGPTTPITISGQSPAPLPAPKTATPLSPENINNHPNNSYDKNSTDKEMTSDMTNKKNNIHGTGSGSQPVKSDRLDDPSQHPRSKLTPTLNVSREVFTLPRFQKRFEATKIIDVPDAENFASDEELEGSGGSDGNDGSSDGSGNGPPSRPNQRRRRGSKKKKAKIPLIHRLAKKLPEPIQPDCTPGWPGRLLRSTFPSIGWLFKNYHWRRDFIADFFVGLTIVIFQVPQSMGYSLIARVPPVYGLYSSFFPCIVYTFMGSSRHASIGTFAIISLMTGNLIVQLQDQFRTEWYKTSIEKATTRYSILEDDDEFLAIGSGAHTTHGSGLSIGEPILPPAVDEDGGFLFGALNLTHLEEDYKPPYENIEIAVMVAAIIGAYQLIFGLLHLGFVSVYMSEPLISAFSTASSIYVFTSQLPYLMGVALQPRSGVFALALTYRDVFQAIPNTNLVTLLLSFCSIVALLFFKLVVTPSLRRACRMNITFPVELLIVIIATILSSTVDFHGRYGIKTVGEIPEGLPEAKLPKWALFKILWARCFTLSIVAFTLTLSVGKVFARKFKYEIDSNQELLALGTCNTISSFFSCLPSAAALSRTSIQADAGGRTQLVSLVNATGIFFVLLYVGPLLEALPNCVLASIIAVALKTLLSQMWHFVEFWKVSKLDGSIWMVTFWTVLILNVDYGLVIGLVYSLLTLIYKSQRPKSYLLGSVSRAVDVFVPISKYLSAREIPGIKIYRFCGPLHFANTDFFKRDLKLKVGFCVNEIIKKRTKQGTCKTIPLPHESIPTHLIIDCSMLSYVDSAGVKALTDVVQECSTIKIIVYMTSLSCHVVKMLDRDGFFRKVPPKNLFITLADAISYILDDQPHPLAFTQNSKSSPYKFVGLNLTEKDRNNFKRADAEHEIIDLEGKQLSELCVPIVEKENVTSQMHRPQSPTPPLHTSLPSSSTSLTPSESSIPSIKRTKV